MSGQGLTQAFGPHRTRGASVQVAHPGGGGRAGVTQGHQSHALVTGESVEGEGGPQLGRQAGDSTQWGFLLVA